MRNAPASPTLAELLAGIPVLGRSGDWRAAVAGLVTDSRRVVPGALFFALDGLRASGARFVDQAVAHGAAAVVSGHPVAGIPAVAAAQVAAPRQVLAEVARRFHGHPERALRLVGVTGTNGKTTVVSLLRHLLERAEGRPWGLLGTVRYHLGARSVPSFKTTPESSDLAAFFAAMRDAGCAGAALEVSSHALEQERVHGFPFAVAAFTNLTRDHLDYHGSLEAYLRAKARLFDGSVGPRPGVAVLNADDPASAELARACGPVPRLTYGVERPADLTGRILSMDLGGTRLAVTHAGRETTFALRLPGGYNVANLLCALACCRALGHDPLALAPALEGFPGVPGRMERVEAGQAFPVFVDYAHTDDALRHALGMLRAITPGRVLCVFGCGGDRDRGKRPAMTRAVVGLADLAWATADNPRREPLARIFDDMRAGADGPGGLAFVEDRREAIAAACAAARPGDCVLVAGKGHETTQEFAETVVPFDDREVARDVLLRLALRPA
jgi:UDP-N-acetylmuramoyl-L-alanyl-D-glutamate--2,6-diaminopimelate ligase